MTRNQILGACVVVVSVLMISTAQLTDLFGPTVAKSIVSAAAILNGILGGWVTLMSGQAGMIKDVAAMPGVSRVSINPQASSAVAAVAVDPTQPKVGGATPQVQEQLKAAAGA